MWEILLCERRGAARTLSSTCQGALPLGTQVKNAGDKVKYLPKQSARFSPKLMEVDLAGFPRVSCVQHETEGRRQYAFLHRTALHEAINLQGFCFFLQLFLSKRKSRGKAIDQKNRLPAMSVSIKKRKRLCFFKVFHRKCGKPYFFSKIREKTQMF